MRALGTHLLIKLTIKGRSIPNIIQHISVIFPQGSPVAGIIRVPLGQDVAQCDVFLVPGEPDLAIGQVEVGVEPVEETVAQEDHGVMRVVHRLDIGFAVVLSIVLGAPLQVVLLLDFVVLAAEVELNGRQLVEVADLA